MTAKDFGAAITSRFARITTTGKLIPEIDGLRFLAISAIVLYHAMQQLAARNGIGTTFESHQGLDRALVWLLSQGRLGVQFFFVLSGFVLGQQYSESHHRGLPPPALARFYLRRLSRLEPPYVLNLVLSYLLVASLFTLGLRAKGAGFAELLPHLAASIAYMHAFVYHDMSAVNGVAWSLEVEAQFYLLMPLIGFLIYRINHNTTRYTVLAATIAASSVIVSGTTDAPWFMEYTLAGYLGYFLTGILLADLHSAHPEWRECADARWDLAALGALGLLWATEFFSGYEAHVAVLFAVMFQAALCGRFLRRFLRLPGVWVVGGMCYTLYLYHLWIVGLGAQALRFAYHHDYPFWLNFCLLFPVLAVAVLIICAVLYVLVERPCMRRNWPALALQRLQSKA